MTQQLNLPLTALKREWIDRVALAVLRNMNNENFTVDDLHGLFADPEHDNWWGALLAKLKNEGKIERVGYKPSNRPERNGGVIAIWRIK